MPHGTLFISYSHRDMTRGKWLDRLKVYVEQFVREEQLDVWDDTRIPTGCDWRLAIKAAMERANAAILLVGPDFLASKFIAQQELPFLLDAAANRGTKIYPLVVGYCAYESSCLRPLSAVQSSKTFRGPQIARAEQRAQQTKWGRRYGVA
jgi:internalin A